MKVAALKGEYESEYETMAVHAQLWKDSLDCKSVADLKRHQPFFSKAGNAMLNGHVKQI